MKRAGGVVAVATSDGFGVWYSGSLFVSDTIITKSKAGFGCIRNSPFTGSERGYLDGNVRCFTNRAGINIAKNALFVADTNNHQIRKVSLKTGAAKR